VAPATLDRASAKLTLWRLARDHSFRPRPARDGRWREDRKIGVAACEAIEADLAISYGGKLTAQEIWWRTMLGGWPEGVNNTDTRARLARGDEIVEQVTRCFPPRPPGNGGATTSMTQYATPDASAALAEAQHRAELAEQRLSDMKAMLADMTAQRDDVKADRNRWRTQAEATQRLLSDATARAARPWWKRLAG